MAALSFTKLSIGNDGYISQSVPAIPCVEDERDADEPGRYRDVGEVAGPELIGACRHHVTGEVRKHRFVSHKAYAHRRRETGPIGRAIDCHSGRLSEVAGGRRNEAFAMLAAGPDPGSNSRCCIGPAQHQTLHRVEPDGAWHGARRVSESSLRAPETVQWSRHRNPSMLDLSPATSSPCAVSCSAATPYRRISRQPTPRARIRCGRSASAAATTEVDVPAR